MELEAKVGELNHTINELAADKANLESRVTILVRVLHMRDDEIAQLQQKLKVGAQDYDCFRVYLHYQQDRYEFVLLLPGSIPDCHWVRHTGMRWTSCGALVSLGSP